MSPLPKLVASSSLGEIYKLVPDEPPANEQKQQEWPKPKPLPSATIAVDKFDYEILPAGLRPWIKDTSNRLQCPPEYVAVAAITALGSLIGRRLGIRPQVKTDWLQIPNLWGMFIGPPGFMKSPAMDEALKHLHRLEIEARKKNEEAIEAHEKEVHAFKLKKEAIIAGAREALKGNPAAKVNLDFGKEPEPPAKVRYVTNDSTYEGLGELLIDNPNGILVERDEIVSLLTYLDAEINANTRSFYAGQANRHMPLIVSGADTGPSRRLSSASSATPNRRGPLHSFGNKMLATRAAMV